MTPDISDSNGKSSLTKRRFTSPWSQKRGDKDDEGLHGPIGLRLLHYSPEPLIDLIFVHGLRGGSIKTWRKGNDRGRFWPQDWLPVEPGFENVNIHTFGYDSDWANFKSSILGIHDFGQGLLEEMRNAPYLRDDGERPIILIGHSMGGLIIKKAYILAQNVSDFKSRIRAVFFLGTPQRGSDYASTLNNIFNVFGIISRNYMSDLTAGSISMQVINNDFGKHAHDLRIFSFYEALKTSFGISSIYVVDKESAVLGPGYQNERVHYINANHRGICKFESKEDPNYVTMKNALASAIADLLEDVSIIKRKESREQMRILRSYLGVSDIPDVHHPKVNGSCQWIHSRDDFRDWRDCTTDFLAKGDSGIKGRNDISVFWVHANPGTGKTILASHVISHLRKSQLECASYFFNIGDKASQSLGPFLRSIAYQMAMSNLAIRNRLSQLCQEGSTFDMDDSWTIWMKLFRKGIFQARVYVPQYFVLDAIDECNKYREFFTMLKGEKPNFPLRFFITSRNMHDMRRLQKSLEPSALVTCIEIPVQDTIRDISFYIQSRIDSLPVDSIPEREKLARRILSKSNACFLWVRLVFDELENVYSSESITTVLDGIPEDMIPFYERTIKGMAANTLEKHIAKAVLLWSVASTRKLTIPELSQALTLDTNAVLPSAKSAVEGLCGHLVSVHEESGIVDLVHPTAREFLLSEAAGEFRVSEPNAHERIALTCLQLLSGSELRPPRNPRIVTHARPEPSPLLNYAMTQFSEHFYTASSENDKLLSATDQFFRSNMLSWIERLLLDGNFHSLIRTSKNVKGYLERRAKYRSPLSSQVKYIDSWSTDLSRLVTYFGEALLQDPSSIYFLIPPLCPSESAIYQLFGRRPYSLLLVGSKRTMWDDCVAYVSFGEDVATSISCDESLIAVAMKSGDVILYNHRSCQKEAIVHNKEFVDLVHLTDNHIALCTPTRILLQDRNGNIIWKNRMRFCCLLLTSSDNHIIAVTQHGHLLQCDKDTGELLKDQVFRYREYDADGLGGRAPQVASISPDFETLALGYRGGVVCLWDIHEAEFIGWARDEVERFPAKLLFNPNPNVDLLLVIYTDHGLALYESWSGSLVHSRVPPDDMGFLAASCSPDGRTLVTMDTDGNMHIWDFESLSVLYHIVSPYPSFRILGFTSDSASVVDVMRTSMRIWSPDVLVRKNTEEDASTGDDAVQLAITGGEREPRINAGITVMCAHQSAPAVLAGKSNGQVIAFDTKVGVTTLLYSHSNIASITSLAVGCNNRIASADDKGRVQIWPLSLPTVVKSDALPFAKIHGTGRVKQLCFSANGEYLLVATNSSDSVYRVEDGSCAGSQSFKTDEREQWKWLIFPSQIGVEGEQEFSLLSDGTIYHFSAESFPSPSTNYIPKIDLQFTLNEGKVMTDIISAVASPESGILALEVGHISGPFSSATTFLFDISDARLSSTESPSANIISLAPVNTLLSGQCRYFLGLSSGTTRRFLFLHKNSWLCTTSLTDLVDRRYTQHFFLPNDYLSRDCDEVPPVKTAQDDVVFCLHEELTSVRNGLRFQAVKTLE